MPRFTATIVKVGVLRSVVVPPKIVAALGSEARYAGTSTMSTLNPAGGSKRRLVLQMDILRPAQLDAGDRLAIELERDTGPRAHPLPDDLRRALQFRPTAAAEFERTSPSSRRLVVELLGQSRTPQTRQRRLEKLIERLAENASDRVKKS